MLVQGESSHRSLRNSVLDAWAQRPAGEEEAALQS